MPSFQSSSLWSTLSGFQNYHLLWLNLNMKLLFCHKPWSQYLQIGNPIWSISALRKVMKHLFLNWLQKDEKWSAWFGGLFGFTGAMCWKFGLFVWRSHFTWTKLDNGNTIRIIFISPLLLCRKYFLDIYVRRFSFIARVTLFSCLLIFYLVSSLLCIDFFIFLTFCEFLSLIIAEYVTNQRTLIPLLNI